MEGALLLHIAVINKHCALYHMYTHSLICYAFHRLQYITFTPFNFLTMQQSIRVYSIVRPSFTGVVMQIVVAVLCEQSASSRASDRGFSELHQALSTEEQK